MRHKSQDELQAGLDAVRTVPRSRGELVLIVRRPASGERQVVAEAQLDLAAGLQGDDWSTRGCPLTVDGSSDFERQITIMNTEAIALVTNSRDEWPLAGDQLYVTMSLDVDSLPPGTRISIGDAILEASPVPHTGCGKFRARFGAEALALVNSPEGRRLRLRGLNTRVVGPGTIRSGDPVRVVVETSG
jgi:hypothetical protein